jgi:hypothetical protein
MSATSGNGSTQFYKGGEDVLPSSPSRTDLSPAAYTSKAVGGARKVKRSVASAKMIGCAGGTKAKKTKKTAKKSRKTAKKSYKLFGVW